MVIAIDGPAGAGKSSVARGVAAALGFTYLDSGAMYRCAALAGIERGADLDDGEAMGEIAGQIEIRLEGERVELDGRDVTDAIREPAITDASSRVSVHPAVREAMGTALDRINLRRLDLASGAGHDTVQMAHLGPVGMLFVPSAGGRSHCPEEWTSPEQLEAGASALLATLLELDRQ